MRGSASCDLPCAERRLRRRQRLRSDAAAARFTHCTTDTRGARAIGTLRANTKSKMDIPEGGGWHGARSLLEWAPGPSGARRGRGQPAWLRRPPAAATARPSPAARPRLHRSAEPWLAPGRAIQLRVVRCIAVVARLGSRPTDAAFESSSLRPLYQRYSYWAPGYSYPPACRHRSKFEFSRQRTCDALLVRGNRAYAKY